MRTKPHKRPACINCEYCFNYYEWDEADSYFCNEDQDECPRPRCGSVFLKEDFITKEEEDAIGSVTQAEHDLYHSRYEAWQDWKLKHEVEPHWICDKHKVKHNAKEASGE